MCINLIKYYTISSKGVITWLRKNVKNGRCAAKLVRAKSARAANVAARHASLVRDAKAVSVRDVKVAEGTQVTSLSQHPLQLSAT
jgi:hypothetical protein